MDRLEQIIWAATVVARHGAGQPIGIAIDQADDLLLFLRQEVQDRGGVLHSRPDLELEEHACRECGDPAQVRYDYTGEIAWYCSACWAELEPDDGGA